MNSGRLLTILLVGMLLSACAQFTPYRFQTLDVDSQPKVFKCAVDAAAKANDPKLPLCEDQKSANAKSAKERRKLCEDPTSADCHAIQHRLYVSKDGQRGNYYLSFVEFDDQGWFADRKQMEALFALLKKLEMEGKEEQSNGHTLIYVYAHGWKHNASSCDDNVVCFSRLLERHNLFEVQTEIKRAERNFENGKCHTGNLLADGYCVMQFGKEIANSVRVRKVVGVYLGWRGLPFDGVLNNLSFWSRKDTAARVGGGGVFELLTRLKNYRDSRQGGETADTDPDKTQLVITGHSFGGLVIYSALSHALMERAAKIENVSGPTQYDVARSFGDFVMLVNPAFEGSLYEPLFHIATNRCYDDPDKPEREKQRPVMMIVTSKADSATSKAFPIGRTLGTLFQHAKSSDQKQSMRKAIGHDERYRTHDLNSTATVQLTAATDATDAKPGTALKYTVTLSTTNNTGGPITVIYAYNKGRTDIATAGTDYDEAITTVKIPKGKNSAVITVPVIDDAVSEGTETVSVTLTKVSTIKASTEVSDPFALGVTVTQTANITDEKQKKTKGEKEPCPCPHLAATSDSSLEELLGTSLDSLMFIGLNPNSPNLYGKGVSLKPVESPTYASSYPYLVVNTDKGVIADHNAIYNDRFILFTQMFFINHILNNKSLPGDKQQCWDGKALPNCTAGGLVPCGQSCQLANENSCSVP